MTCEKFERVTMRGADQPLRSLAEAFPEFVEALDGLLSEYQSLAKGMRHATFGDWPEVIKARAVLKRMRGEP